MACWITKTYQYWSSLFHKIHKNRRIGICNLSKNKGIFKFTARLNPFPSKVNFLMLSACLFDIINHSLHIGPLIFEKGDQTVNESLNTDFWEGLNCQLICFSFTYISLIMNNNSLRVIEKNFAIARSEGQHGFTCCVCSKYSDTVRFFQKQILPFFPRRM